MTTTERLRTFASHLHDPGEAASGLAFRALLAGIVCFSAVRFVVNGWVDLLYVQPTYYFKYPFFEWVVAPSAPWVYTLFGVVIASSAFVAVASLQAVSTSMDDEHRGAGAFDAVLRAGTRPALILLLLSFTYLQVQDVTNYLNHYYLVGLLVVVLALLPVPVRTPFASRALRPAAVHAEGQGATALAASGRSGTSGLTWPRYALWLLRGQFAIVYFYAGLAKANPDWLLHAQPLGIWLQAREEWPVLGAFFRLPGSPWLMSWAGFLFDLTIPVWLLIRRTRLVAFGVLVVFHLMTALLFDIGIFPWLMIAGGTLFLGPNWPVRVGRALRTLAGHREAETSPVVVAPADTGRQSLRTPHKSWAVPVALGYLCMQGLLPLRHYAIGGPVLWDELGMRFAWKVMVREKNASVTYRVVTDRGETEVSPHDYLVWRQANEMSGQPDLIVQLAQHIGREFSAAGHRDVKVFADTWASLNGRRRARLLDPTVDLMLVANGPFAWDDAHIAPMPQATPLTVTRAPARGMTPERP